MLHSNSYVCTPRKIKEVISYVRYAREYGMKICPAGSRLSFSNVCLIDNNILLDMRKMDKIIAFSPEKKEITVEAGMLTIDLLSFIAPNNLILAGLSGSQGNTIGGDVSSDVNGKDTWKYGNFGSNILAMKLVDARGEVRNLVKGKDDEIIHAVIGGLGLIGIIVEVTLRLLPIPSFKLLTQSYKVNNIEQLIEVLDAVQDEGLHYAYCWTDPYVKGRKEGRGIIEKGMFIRDGENEIFPEFQKVKNKKTIYGLSPMTFWKLSKPATSKLGMKVANSFKYHLNSKNEIKEKAFEAFQYPMVHILPSWNMKYYPDGFREWQILFPKEVFTSSYREVLGLCRKYEIYPALCAVKKHVSQDSYLSFSDNGYSLTINYGIRAIAEKKFMFEKELVSIILANHGKVYLSKFPFFSQEVLKQMYPNFGKFMEVKKSVDSDGLFSSNAYNYWMNS